MPTFKIQLDGKDVKDNYRSVANRLRDRLRKNGYKAKVSCKKDNSIEVYCEKIGAEEIEKHMKQIQGSMVGKRGRWFSYKIKGEEEKIEGDEKLLERIAELEKQIKQMQNIYETQFEKQREDIIKLAKANEALVNIKKALTEELEDTKKKLEKLREEYQGLSNIIEEIGEMYIDTENVIKNEIKKYASKISEIDIEADAFDKVLDAMEYSEDEWIKKEYGKEVPHSKPVPWEKTEYYAKNKEKYGKAVQELEFLDKAEKKEVKDVPEHLLESLVKSINKERNLKIKEEFEKKKNEHEKAYEEYNKLIKLKEIHKKSRTLKEKVRSISEIPMPILVHDNKIFLPVRGNGGILSKLIYNSVKKEGCTEEIKDNITILKDLEIDLEEIKKSLENNLEKTGLKFKVYAIYS